MNKNSKKSIFEKLGFTADQSLIYTSLLELGPSSISIIVRNTGLHRPTVYKLLPILIDRGLISVMPKGKYKIYIPESPEKLERLITELEDEFNIEIHSLMETYEARGKKPIVKFSEGEKAIKEMFSDVVHSLKKNDVYYRYSSALTLARKKYVPDDYRQVRDRKGLERYIISDNSMKDKGKRLGKAIKTIPEGINLFDLDITQTIYGNKVAFIDYNTKTVITIENALIAEFQKKIFKLLYSRL